MSLVRINAIVGKQIQDTLKNKAVLIQFVMFPAMAFILTLSAKDFVLEPNFFVNMFGTMYTSMAPIIVISTIVSEDKEKGSLQALRMANVKPFEYIIGITFYVFILCLMGLLSLTLIGNFTTKTAITFIASNTIGLIISSLIGSIIGLVSPNQSAASGLSVPAMLVFSFLPMISLFNSSIHKFSKYIYSQQISDIINGVQSNNSTLILLVNIVIALVLYFVVYKKYKYK